MNRATLAVAGSRKTQSIVDACTNGPTNVRRLAVTYTISGQTELERRLRSACPPGAVPEVVGWYAFLMRHCIRPYLPLKYPGRHLRGLNFDGKPTGGLYATGAPRFLDSDNRAYKLHLSKLAYDVVLASKGAVIDRLVNIYNEIYIDEVQDLTGCDLHILEILMNADGIDIHMVGDVRQSVFDTNPQDQNLKKYRGVKMLDWFNTHEESGLLEVQHNADTWRSNQEIATFSDTIFPPKFTFPTTTSKQELVTEHDGVYAISESDVEEYLATYHPQPLRPKVTVAKAVDLPFQNFGAVKGLTFERTLIYPTQPIVQFLTRGKPLADQSACGLYVAVTRAISSVAFVVPDPNATKLRHWRRGRS
ncbi:UvrD-helicase domain-containing protein [Promicromonospora sp. MS192]|uniref:UvrD-helicase domain-containing protein n=1 Tax=Promicromonospora sp. MS192 TaxID=3412684 RepID=UPI003C2FB56F